MKSTKIKKVQKQKRSQKMIKNASGKSNKNKYNNEIDKIDDKLGLRDKINKYIEEKNITQANTVKQIKEMCTNLDIYVPSKYTKPILIERLEIPPAIKKNNLLARLTTLQYECIKDYINTNYEIDQPEFEEKDKEAKKKIWNLTKEKKDKDGNIITYNSSAFSDISGDINKGDHIYGIREGLKKTGFIGSNSQWNMIPCTQKENVSWKIVEINGIKKNLVYDEFTADEESMFDDETKEKYDKLKNWRKYCESRGAKLYWKNGIEINKIITQEIDPILNELNEKIKSLDVITQKEELAYSEEDKELVNEEEE